MNLMKKLNKIPQKLEWWDISLIKWSSIMFALLLAKFFPVLLSAHWSVYAGLAVLLSIHPLMKFFR